MSNTREWPTVLEFTKSGDLMADGSKVVSPNGKRRIGEALPNFDGKPRKA